MSHLLWVLVLALAGAASSAASSGARSYHGYRLVHAVPRDSSDAKALHDLSSWNGVDMWNRRAAPGAEATLMVAPGATQRKVLQDLAARGVPHTINPTDVQSLVEKEALDQQLVRSQGKIMDGGASFDQFMRYAEIDAYLQQLQESYPDLVTLANIGLSTEGRNMTVIRVSRNGGDSPRAVLVDAGIHAREWIAPATALYLINRLVEHGEEHADLLDGLDWYILPLVNPDGYEYTFTNDRFWRKNRGAKRTTWFKWLWDLLCAPGADLNRNFGFHWMQNGASSFPCAETFAGETAFSEVESQNLRDFILRANKDKRIKMYLTLHSYGPMILYPYGYDTRLDPAPDAKELAAIGNEANAAMVKAGSEPFVVENSADLYAAAGGSDDWAKGVAGIAKSYTIELQGGGSNGFDIPASKIQISVEQTFEGLKVFASHAKNL